MVNPQKPEDIANALQDVIHKPETKHRGLKSTSADRQAKYRARMRAAGYVKLTVWVPVEYKRAVEQFVRDLTKARVAREKKSPAGERGE